MRQLDEINRTDRILRQLIMDRWVIGEGSGAVIRTAKPAMTAMGDATAKTAYPGVPSPMRIAAPGR
jgi:hypothetical protein